jgi:hypothetical protein
LQPPGDSLGYPKHAHSYSTAATRTATLGGLCSWWPELNDPEARRLSHESIRRVRAVIGINQEQILAGADCVEFGAGCPHRRKAVATRALADEIAQVACACVDADVLVEQLADPIVDRPEQSGRVYVVSRSLLLAHFRPWFGFANLRHESPDR